MQSGNDRAIRGLLERRVQSTRRSVGGATFCFLASHAYGLMIAPLRTVLEQSNARRVTPRLSVGRARSWTGRSAVAGATDSHLSRLATAGTRVTRVSAMRFLPVRADRLALQRATVVTDHVTPLRRMDPGPLITGG
jgi:hypothetical protein